VAKQMRITAAGIALVIVFSSPLFAGGISDDTGVSGAERGVRIIASTSWVAAIAEAAGAENVRVLAPVELRHPPEYELRPSDLREAGKADIILYAGWEMFAPRLADSAGGANTRIITVNAVNDPPSVIAEVRRLSALFGTGEKAEKWIASYRALAGELREKVMAAWPVPLAAVNEAQEDFARWLGFEITGVAGPGELSPPAVLQLVRTSPVVVIDNYHNPLLAAAAESAKVPLVECVNFPGRDGTRSMEDVLRYNAELLINAAGSFKNRSF
jgi:hypothetical protein